ncbi:MAG: GerMN domain-containing protein [Candidatus Acidiferrales bacterium]
MSRTAKIAAAFLGLWVALAAYWLHTVQQVARIEEHSDERARREITLPPVASASDKPVKAQLYRVNAAGTAIEPVTTELSLSADAAVRARQLVAALAALEPAGGVRTLPPDTALLEFYLLPDGAAVADFSAALSSAMPSGILSEHLAIDAIARTLADNITDLRRLKIVIAGQEMETLAGHVDLTSFIELGPATAAEKSAKLTP